MKTTFCAILGMVALATGCQTSTGTGAAGNVTGAAQQESGFPRGEQLSCTQLRPIHDYGARSLRQRLDELRGIIWR